MRIESIKRLARLWPCLLLVLAMLLGFHIADRINRSADAHILQIAKANASLFQQQIENKATRVRESFKALATSPVFSEAWDEQDAVTLLHEINNITRFLERIGAVEQIILKTSADRSVVNLSATQTRLPNTLAENPGQGSPLRLTEGGELFLLTEIPFNGSSSTGHLHIWQTANPEHLAGATTSDIWAALTLSKETGSTRIQADLLSQPPDGVEWSTLIECRTIQNTPCLFFRHAEHIFAGAALTPITLHPSNANRGLAWLQDVTEIVSPIYKMAHLCFGLASFMGVLTLITGTLLLKKSHHQLCAESLQIERDAALAKINQSAIEKEGLSQQLQIELEHQKKLKETQNAMQTRMDKQTTTLAELRALVDTLKAELDGPPSAGSSIATSQAQATITELKGLLQQCNSALEAAHQEQNETLAEVRSLEKRLDAARKDVTRQEELMINQNAGSTVLEEQIEQLKKQNAELEARVMGLQQAYMTTLEEFQTYRENFEVQESRKNSTAPMPPQMEFNLGAVKPIRLLKEIELPSIINRLKERLVARKSGDAEFNLRTVCEKAVVSQERTAQKSGLELALRLCPGTVEEVVGDPVTLELLLINLLRFNSLATSDGFVPIEVSVEVIDDKSGELILSIQNNGCSRSLHPWTNWVANPHQADCHENEVAAKWCANLISRAGGRIAVDNKLPHVSCQLILPIKLSGPAIPKPGPFSGETVAVMYTNKKSRDMVSEQLRAWGLQVEEIKSATELTPSVRALVIEESLRRSEELGVISDGNPELPILLGDINRSKKFLSQLTQAIGYETLPITQIDLFGSNT